MNTVGIAIEKWKLPIFRRLLGEAGFSFDQSTLVRDDIILLKVRTTSVMDLTRVVKAAQAEALESREGGNK